MAKANIAKAERIADFWGLVKLYNDVSDDVALQDEITEADYETAYDVLQAIMKAPAPDLAALRIKLAEIDLPAHLADDIARLLPDGGALAHLPTRLPFNPGEWIAAFRENGGECEAQGQGVSWTANGPEAAAMLDKLNGNLDRRAAVKAHLIA